VCVWRGGEVSPSRAIKVTFCFLLSAFCFLLSEKGVAVAVGGVGGHKIGCKVPANLRTGG
jgi:hypothetical protein